MQRNDQAKQSAMNASTRNAVRPNPKNPWTRKIKNKHRLKAMLRQAGLHHSFFTKKRTRARQKNYMEAVRAISHNHGSENARGVEKIWGYSGAPIRPSKGKLRTKLGSVFVALKGMLNFLRGKS